MFCFRHLAPALAERLEFRTSPGRLVAFGRAEVFFEWPCGFLFLALPFRF